MTNRFHKRAEQLRAIADPYYNCCQAVLVHFAEEVGIREDAAMRIASNYGAGMKRGAQCGAICGGLMVLGLFGVEDPQSISSYYNALRESHNNLLDCADLLKVNAEAGREKKLHCDAMGYECVDLVYEMLKGRGLIEV